jgi:hypothetical protein
MKRETSVKLLLGITFVIGFGAGCGDDTPYVPKDAGADAPMDAPTFTDFVKDLITNHTDDPTPVPYDTFKGLPDPDGDNNNASAYDSLFH